MISLEWSRREPPLTPAAVAATGAVIDSLRTATINRLPAGVVMCTPDEAAVAGTPGPANRSGTVEFSAAVAKSGTVEKSRPGGELRAVGGNGWLVVLGDSADLPWADGAIYLGWDSGLLVPTTSAPSPPAGLLRRALPQVGLVILLPDHLLVSKAPIRLADPVLLAGV